MDKNVCPWWIGFFLASPIRKLWHNPFSILSPYIKKGETLLDAGCAMGFFSIPMARMAGEKGRVICVDLQEKMLAHLKRRAWRSGLQERITARQCPPGGLGLEEFRNSIDFALAFALVHELPEPGPFFMEVNGLLKPGGLLLFAEPRGHVSGEEFRKSLDTALGSGFEIRNYPRIRGCISAVFIKNN